ncbi:MAG: DUF4253 domain-containing protein [Candidatus Melainabacteria bacterium]|nr:DUF4253 domain-containing protein [Candidatus Melainabacteria bacterium]
MPNSKGSVEQKLKQLGISLPVSTGLFSYPSMYYLTVPGGDAFAIWQKLANNNVKTGFWPLIWLDKKEHARQKIMVTSELQPLQATLRDFGIVQKHPIDIKELNQRIANRPDPKYYPFMKEAIVTQEQAERADALLQLQIKHKAETVKIGFLPGTMPTSSKQMFDTVKLSQVYFPLMMSIIRNDQAHLTNADRQNRLNGLRPTASQTAEICRRGEHLDFQYWLRKTEKSDTYYKVERGKYTGPADAQEESHAAFTYDYDRKLAQYVPRKNVIILLVPTTYSWQVPAYLGFGNINANPECAVHVAAMKHWHYAYGADLISLKDDSLEFYVSRPPKDETAAMQLAREHFIYCPDSVFQGTDTLGKLAGKLCRSHFWNFWWD